jgi:hypothetical protein
MEAMVKTNYSTRTNRVRLAAIVAVGLGALLVLVPNTRSQAAGVTGTAFVQAWQEADGWWNNNGNVDYFGMRLLPAGGPCGAAGTCQGVSDENRPLDWAIWGTVRNACNTGNPPMSASLKRANRIILQPDPSVHLHGESPGDRAFERGAGRHVSLGHPRGRGGFGNLPVDRHWSNDEHRDSKSGLIYGVRNLRVISISLRLRGPSFGDVHSDQRDNLGVSV